MIHPMTERVLARFAEINAHPRRSYEEARLAAWIAAWADANGFGWRQDAVGNLVVVVPASPGAEAAPTVVLQGHLDMVCEKEPGSAHDFSRDPVVNVRDGDWLRASGTSLGADDGIAVAVAMELAVAADVVHPALELLFTVDEEVGMTGALRLDPALITGRTLINIDGEDDGVLTVGCAGGIDTLLRVPLPAEPVEGDALSIRVGGLFGGHSGLDVHLNRANAIRVLATALEQVAARTELRIVDLAGGTALNAIPRSAGARILADRARVEEALAALRPALAAAYGRTDPELFVSVDVAGPADRAWTVDASRRAIAVLLALPHGVATMSSDVPGLVETSNNEATVRRDGDDLVVQSSQRSSVPSRLAAITAQVEAVGRLAGGTVVTDNGYPPWPPDMASALLARCQRLYAARFGRPAKVEVMHAGLECGVIGERVPGMDMISVGPTIRDPHSPSEKLHVPTVGRLWDLLVDLLADLARG